MANEPRYLVLTRFPGQHPVLRPASPVEMEHYLTKRWDLPFVTPQGRLAEEIAKRRTVQHVLEAFDANTPDDRPSMGDDYPQRQLRFRKHPGAISAAEAEPQTSRVRLNRKKGSSQE